MYIFITKKGTIYCTQMKTGMKQNIKIFQIWKIIHNVENKSIKRMIIRYFVLNECSRYSKYECNWNIIFKKKIQEAFCISNKMLFHC